MKLLHLIAPLLLLAAGAAQADDATYRTLGRYADADGGGQTFAWPASGVEGRFVGARLVAHIEESGTSLMDLDVDGVMTQLQLETGARDYTLFSAQTPGEHYVRLTRRSEVGSGLTTIRSLTLDGQWRALPAHAHRILFVGDSITVGYGAAGADEHCHYSAETSPPFDSYAARTASAFDADFEVVAISGRGVVRNYGGFDAHHMSELIDAALPDHPEMHWDAAKFSPELIVINLGANDFSTADPGPTFEPAYLAMLRTLRQRYPRARIITAFGPEPREDAIPRITAVTQTYNHETGERIPFLYLPRAATGHIFGCDYHPGEDTHALMAQALEAKIVHDLGWRRVHH
ncbi:MAG TPA: GDSL-type esterase/lipase family protein [Caulobacterales bacterium]|nr:GDSL-type esterase/lipase family protein [Caulobacterales bacterium]